MRLPRIPSAAAVLLTALPFAAVAVEAAGSDGEWSGFAAVEARGYLGEPSFAGQSSADPTSLVLEPEFYKEFSGGDQSFTFKPFLRLDSIDSERTHFDIRELYWLKARRNWELQVGVSKVFWGVTEAQHLVDIVNQTDQVENPDGEDKLGQPMVRLGLVRDWGILEFYLLPGFRERTFAGPEGRLRPDVSIDADHALYQSSAGREHVDFAVRWSQAVGAFDLGLSWFDGTNREPGLIPATGDSEIFVPYYEQITQAGLDAQATLGNWLLKLEAIERSGRFESFAAATSGFEYTFWAALDSKVDLGLVAEYLWDERDLGATTPFADDIFAAARLAFNDTQSTEILVGAILDNRDDGSLFVVEASRRVGSSWIVELEVRTFSGSRPSDPVAFLRSDDFVQLSVQRHF